MDRGRRLSGEDSVVINLTVAVVQNNVWAFKPCDRLSDAVPSTQSQSLLPYQHGRKNEHEYEGL